MVTNSKSESSATNNMATREQLEDNVRVDALTILANLTNASELTEAQASLGALKAIATDGDKRELIKMLATHAALLDALSIRLLSDAHKCKDENLTVTILELSLKSFDVTRKTILATHELLRAPAPVVAVQING